MNVTLYKKKKLSDVNDKMSLFVSSSERKGGIEARALENHRGKLSSFVSEFKAITVHFLFPFYFLFFSLFNFTFRKT